MRMGIGNTTGGVALTTMACKPLIRRCEFKVFSVNRFYDCVCTFTEHQLLADPLLDVLIYFLKE